MTKKAKVQRVRLEEPPEETDAQVLAQFLNQQEQRASFEAEQSGRPQGRPSTYQDRYARIARILCSMGATDKILSEAFGVSITQIQNWYTMHPEFGKAVREGKVEVFDPQVERALAQRALGYAIDIEEVKITKDGDVIRYPVRKHYPPDVTAQIFWLKNRQPKKWRDVWKIDHTGKIDTTALSPEKLLEEIQKEAAALGLLPQQLATLGVASFPKPNGAGKKLN